MSTDNLAIRLKRLRESKGLTKYRLAKLSGVSQTYIYRIERGEIANSETRETISFEPLPHHILTILKDGGLIPHLRRSLGKD